MTPRKTQVPNMPIYRRSLDRTGSRAMRRLAASTRWVFTAIAGICVPACADPVVFREPDAFRLVAAQNSIESDGANSTTVEAILPTSLPQDAFIDFSTSLGRLVTSAGAPDRKATVRAYEGRAAIRLLTTGETGTAYVTATGAGSTRQVAVEFQPAVPTVIDLLLDRSAAPADGATPVTATAVLRRSRGAVSPGIVVQFMTRDSTGGSVLPGLSGIVVSDSNGIARIKITATVPRTAEIRAFVGSVQSEARLVRFTAVAASGGA